MRENFTSSSYGEGLETPGFPKYRASPLPDSRVFGVQEVGNAVISGLTVRNGRADMGGGIGNLGMLTILECMIVGNTAYGANWFPATGGDVLNYISGVMLIDRSTISGNTGGGVLNLSGQLTIQNSTISGNRSLTGYGGGGILNFTFAGPPAVMSIISSTIANNVADESPGFSGRGNAIADAFSPPFSVTIRNSVLANPTPFVGSACFSIAMTSGGHNVATDNNSCGLSGIGDMNAVNPMLAPSASNGGLTLTHAPLAGSPLINAAPLSDCVDKTGLALTLDQRGAARPYGASCDIGSVEIADSTPPSIVPVVSGTIGTNGWYRSGVTVSWTVSDPESSIASSSGCGFTSLTADTPGMTLACSAINSVGLSASASVTLKIDRTPPIWTSLRLPAANGAGWNNTDVTVSCSCSDGLSGVASVAPSSSVVSTEGFNQSVAASCSDNAGNSTAAAVSGINIDKTQPVTSNVLVQPNPVALNGAITLSANLSDGGGSALAGAQYTINGSTPVALGSATGASALVSGALPPFSATGVYNICVAARDTAGNTGSADCLFLPVYDPTGGFVTGGGWITSPPGAYTLDSLLTGKATFGFESRYKNGANVPSGDTQFLFHAGSLNFRSQSYEWLVVAGAKAQFKGSGTINGTGSYNFILTAIDGGLPSGGGVDRFRIKITGPGGLVYDNQLGGTDSDDPTTALGGGNIVIHKN